MFRQEINYVLVDLMYDTFYQFFFLWRKTLVLDKNGKMNT